MKCLSQNPVTYCNMAIYYNILKHNMQHGIDPYCFIRTVQYYYVFIEDVHKARLSLGILIIYHVSLWHE